MDKNQVKDRINKLKKEIEYHRYLYHVLDKQKISDAAIDSLKHELLVLENQYPDLITEDSPTQRIGGKPLDKFTKVKHKVRQWSLNDVFSEKEIREWDERIKKIILEKLGEKLTRISYSCELKIDGLHIVLNYQDGFLKLGATRGDGKIGENVTNNLKTIEAIPLKLKNQETIVVEGEVFMRKDIFKNLNNARKKTGDSLFANPRNAAAGAIRQLNPQITKSRKLDFFAYDISWPEKNIPESQIEELNKLKYLGFKVNKHFSEKKGINEVIALWKEWKDRKESQNYWLDGLVVKVNNRRIQKELGFTGKAPRWAIALKYPGEEATTIIKDIFLSLGRTGKITPVAKLRPVNIAGSTISRANLHNLDEINRLDVRVGDTVIIHKAGDIIPQIKSVIKSLRPQNSTKFTLPLKCPVCNSKIIKPVGEVNYYCSNKNCAMLTRRRLYYFVSKKAFNINGLGPKIIDQLMDVGLLKDSSDIFKLKKEDLIGLDRFAEKSANNLIKSIQNKKIIPLINFLVSLGIKHVGEEVAELIAKKINKLNNKIIFPIDLIDIFSKLNIDELGSIAGVGPKIAKSIIEYFQDKRNKKILKEINRLGVSFSRVEKTSDKYLPLNKLIFVLTGTLNKMSREEAKRKIKLLGGKVSNIVNNKTDFVIVGKNPGSKITKAKKLNIKIINKTDFLDLINKNK